MDLARPTYSSHCLVPCRAPRALPHCLTARTQRAENLKTWRLYEQGRFDSQGASSSRPTFTQGELAAYALAQLRPLTRLVATSQQDTDDFLAYVLKWQRLKALQGAPLRNYASMCGTPNLTML